VANAVPCCANSGPPRVPFVCPLCTMHNIAATHGVYCWEAEVAHQAIALTILFREQAAG